MDEQKYYPVQEHIERMGEQADSIHTFVMEMASYKLAAKFNGYEALDWYRGVPGVAIAKELRAYEDATDEAWIALKRAHLAALAVKSALEAAMNHQGS